jgi:hypothetical protein
VRQTVKGGKGLETKPGAKGEWLLLPQRGQENPQFEIAGQVPASAKKGDVLLVHVAARYPQVKGRAARTVEFLEFVHVIDKKR